VPVVTTFPQPVVAPLPVEVAVYYDDNLRSFEHTEVIDQGTDWNVKLGGASLGMFQELFNSMFETVTEVPSLEAAFAEGDRFEAVIVPGIQEMQVAPPRFGESEYFEAWIQYRVEAYRPDRDPIINWLVSGYGRSEASLLTPASSLQRATVVAMRDAAANILIKFKQQPRVREWLEQQEGGHEIVKGGAD
jgi:hypothetical protein